MTILKMTDLLTKYAPLTERTVLTGPHVAIPFDEERETHTMEWSVDGDVIAQVMFTPVEVEGFITFDLFNHREHRVATIIFHEDSGLTIEGVLCTLAHYYRMDDLIDVWDETLNVNHLPAPENYFTDKGQYTPFALLDTSEGQQFVINNPLNVFSPTLNQPYYRIQLNLREFPVNHLQAEKIVLMGDSRIAIHSTVGIDTVMCRPVLCRFSYLFEEYTHAIKLVSTELRALGMDQIQGTLASLDDKIRVLIQNAQYIDGEDPVPSHALPDTTDYIRRVLNDTPSDE